MLHGRLQRLFRETAVLFDLSLLRIVPSWLKEWVYNESSWQFQRAWDDYTDARQNLVTNGNEILRRFVQQAVVDDSRPVVKFLHLFNTHRPYILDTNCNVAPRRRSGDRGGALDLARCAIGPFVELVQRLKKLRVYDTTMIALIADHGAGLPSRYLEGSSEPGDWQETMALANPAFLLKPFDSDAPFSHSNLPIALSDLAATICASTIGCPTKGGRPILRDDWTGPSKRVFNFYKWNTQYWNDDVIPGVKRLEINGPLKERESWVNFGELEN